MSRAICRRRGTVLLNVVAVAAAILTIFGARSSAQAEASPAANPSPTPARSAAPAQAAEADKAAEAAKLQAEAANPLGPLISIPFQMNANYPVGNDHQFGYTLNVQPVVPLPVGKDTTLIFRTIVPITYVPQISTSPAVGNVLGLGTINPQLYFISNKPSSLLIGPGVALLLPTATNPLIGPNKWAAGPDLAVVKTTKYTVYGFIANNVWTVAGSPEDLNFSTFLFQPFFTRNFAHGVALNETSQITADWSAPGSQKWTLPAYVSLSQLQKKEISSSRLRPASVIMP